MLHSAAIRDLLPAFDQLEISYRIVGSVAGFLLGNPRSTIDVDIVADLKPEQVRPLARLLQGTFYADEEMMLEYVNKKTSFNLLHLPTMVKIDIFPLQQRAYSQQSFDRFIIGEMEAGDETLEVFGLTGEDFVLSKLEWYEMTGKTSERQWNDIQVVLQVQRGKLDLGYMRYWAAELGLMGLLEDALREAESS